MQIILLERIPNLGELGDEVKVRPGYARNFLIPQKRAVYATSDAKAVVEKRRVELAAMEAKRLDAAKARLALAAKSVSITRLVVDEEGKLFGSVTNADIAEAMTANGTEIKRAEVQLPDGALKQTGTYQIDVILHPELHTSVEVLVLGEQGELPSTEEEEA
jgi:large subunit ribosomal protein L9